MKVSKITEVKRFALTYPLRPLYLFFLLYLLFWGSISYGGHVAISKAETYGEAFYQLPLRLVFGPPIIILILLIGEMEV